MSNQYRKYGTTHHVCLIHCMTANCKSEHSREGQLCNICETGMAGI